MVLNTKVKLKNRNHNNVFRLCNFRNVINFILLLFFSNLCQSENFTNYKIAKDFLPSSELLAQDFCRQVLEEVLKSSTSSIQLENNMRNVELSYLQQKYSWLPIFQLDFPQDATLSRGDYTYIINQMPNKNKTLSTTHSVSLSIYQKLPANGNFQTLIGYALSVLPDRQLFLQNPYISLSFSQRIAKGLFGLGKNPESQILELQYSYAKKQYQQSKNEILQQFILALQNYDIACSKKNYYQALVKFEHVKFNEFLERHENGENSDMEFFKEHQNLIYSKQQLQMSVQAKSKYESQLKLFYEFFLDEEIEELKEGLFQILENLNFRFFQNEDFFNLDEELLENEIAQQKYFYDLEKQSYAPQLYFAANFLPDSSLYYEYSDWSKSWRMLKENPEPLKLNATVGGKMNFDVFQSTKIRKEKILTNKSSLQAELDSLKKQNQIFQKIYEEELFTQKQHFISIQKEIEEEAKYLMERKELFENVRISQKEFLESEVVYFEILNNEVQSFWNIIQTELNLIKIKGIKLEAEL